MATSVAVRKRTALQPRVSSGKTTNPYVDISKRLSHAAMFVVAAYLIMLFLFAATSDQPAPLIGVRMLVVSLYVVVSTSPMWMRWQGIGLFHPLYMLAVYGFLKNTLPNAKSLADGVAYHPALRGMSATDISELHIQVMLLKTLSWICIFVGFRAVRGVKWKVIGFRDHNRLLALGAAVSFLIGCIALYFLIGLSGGFSEHLKNITRGHSNKVWVGDAELASIYAILAKLTIVAPAVWILVGKRPFYNPGLWALIIVAVMTGFLINGRRSGLLVAVVVLVACWVWKRRSIALGRLALIGIVMFATVGMLGEFRRSNWSGGEVNFESLQTTDIEATFYKSFEELESRREGGAIYPIVALVPKEVPFLLGKNYFNYINRFIPRVIWKNKPRGVGIDCARIFYHRPNAGGIPPGQLGEAYWSGGLVGVILVFCLWGALLKSIGNFFVRFNDSPTACMLYLATIGTLGPSEPEFRAWLYLAAPIIIVLTVVGVIRFSGAKSAS